MSDDEAFEVAPKIAIYEGITCGAAMVDALKVAARPESEGKTIVVILPDSGESYLSTAMFDGIRN